MKTLVPFFMGMIALPALATPITSPFYLPQAGHVLSQTTAQYTKNKIKNNASMRLYRRNLSEEITLGLGAGMALLINGDLNWTRQKHPLFSVHSSAKSYSAGLKGQWNWESVMAQFTAQYHQTTDVDFAPRRAIEAHMRLGKALKAMTPYLHLAGTFPLNARSAFNAPIYRGETGVFQPIKESMTLDTALYLQYDKNTKERSYGIRAEWSYALTSWMSFGLNGTWQARGKASHSTKTYHQSAGAKITFAF